MKGSDDVNAVASEVRSSIPVPRARPLVSVVVDRRRKPDLGDMGEVDVALEAWARWARSALSGMGWPPMTLLARVIAHGVTGAASRSAMALEADELCELVERGIMRLKEIERTVLVRHYLHWEPIEVASRHCHMSAGRFRTVLHRARRSVRDFMDGAKIALQQNPL